LAKRQSRVTRIGKNPMSIREVTYQELLAILRTPRKR
jgi:hypothetical protein